jgi:hypothetical protein
MRRRRARRSACRRRRQPAGARHPAAERRRVPRRALAAAWPIRCPLARRAVRMLHNRDPDIAVARGAVAYSLARAGPAPAIESGSARSYYLLLDGTRAAGSRRLPAAARRPRRRRNRWPSAASPCAWGGRCASTSSRRGRSGAGRRSRRPGRTGSAGDRAPAAARHRAARRPGAPGRDPVQLAASAVAKSARWNCMRGRRRQRPALAAGVPAARPEEPDVETDAGLPPGSTTPSAHRPHLRRPQPAGRDARSAPAARRPGTPAGRANAGIRRCCGACSTR